MSPIAVLCAGAILLLLGSALRRGADPFSPARVFTLVWCGAIGLTELKFSGLQHEWDGASWALLLIGLGAYLAGTLAAYLQYFNSPLLPLAEMRRRVQMEDVREGRLFGFLCAGVALYAAAYAVNVLIKGWLPVFVIARHVSRVDFNVTGVTLFLYSAAFIVYGTVLYHIRVPGRRGRKVLLAVLAALTVGSYLLLLQRFQIIMTATLSFVLLYYATRHIRFRTVLPFAAAITGFFFWMSSLRLSHLAGAFLYRISEMKFGPEYALFTEPYMYVVMNLENFARAVMAQEYHTFGYFTFDFIAAVAGLKYWVLDYFAISRTPYLISGYNTYTAFYWFYSDFGVPGLAVIPFLWGWGTGVLYYRMRLAPTLRRVTAYAVVLFVAVISFFVFPLMHLWFIYNILALTAILRWSTGRSRETAPSVETA